MRRAGLATYEALQWWVDRFLPAQGSVLDMGCGNSELSVALARAHPSLAVVGIDYSPPLCGLMRELHPAAELLVGDGCRLPLRDGAVDAVVDKGCLDSLLNEADQVRPCRRSPAARMLRLCNKSSTHRSRRRERRQRSRQRE
jgi:SAM-dependent methyltransferase